MPGYSSNQFFNSQEPSKYMTTPTGTNYSGLIPSSNQKFVYPNRTVRDASGTYDLDRGYIRSLTTYSNGINIPIKKCQFQFNPDVLQHSVQANSSMLSFLQQDPAQYAQPMGSSVNFTFQLRFDRSYELNNPTNKVVTTGSVWEANDPSQVGVLHDLAALYNVIGQGIGSTQIDYLSKVMTNTAVAENNARVASSSGTSTSSSSSGALSTDAMNTLRDKTVPDFLQNNIGNVTFLLPVPVRIVFSSLYIVEGLVQASDVTFTKFTANMVPMQCVVQLTMEAKYVGFSKKNTFYTWALEQREKQERADIAAANAKKTDLVSAMSQALQSVLIKIIDLPSLNSTDMNGYGGYYLQNVMKDYYYGFSTKMNPASSYGDDKDPIAVLYNNNANITIDQYSTVVLWGPFTDLSYAKSYDNTKLTSELRRLNSKGQATKLFSSQINSSARGGHVGSLDDWKDVGSPTVGARSVIAKSNGDGYNQDASAGSYSGKAASGYDSSKYYILAMDVSFTAADGDASIKGTGSNYVLINPNYGSLTLNFNVPITWPAAPKDGNGSVGTPYDASVGVPGKTSKVGATTATNSTSKVPAKF